MRQSIGTTLLDTIAHEPGLSTAELARRTEYGQRLDHALARSMRRPDDIVAVLFLDLDDFKGGAAIQDAGDRAGCADERSERVH